MQKQQSRWARCAPASRAGIALALTTALVLVAGEASAREKNGDDASGHRFMGYTGTQWAEDFGVTRGRCDRGAIAKALTDTASAQPGGARTAVLTGTDIEDADRACAAHALELARNHRTVRWTSGGHAMALSTGGDTVANGLPCRPFVLVHRGKRTLGTACQAQPGLWEIQKG